MKAPLIPLSAVLENLFKDSKSVFSEIYFLFQLRQNWRHLAGEEIAGAASPVQFKNQELILALSDSASLQDIHFAREALKKKINRHFPDRKIQKIVLRVERRG